MTQGKVNGYSSADWSGFTSLITQTAQYDNLGIKRRDTLDAGGTTYAMAQYNDEANFLTSCTAVRMNPSDFTSPVANGSSCTLSSTGSYGADRISKPEYDGANQVTKIISAYGTSLQQDSATYTYTNNGLVQTVTDANGNKTTFEYDGFDRLSKIRYPDPSTTGTSSSTDYDQYSYDADGHVTSWRRRDGQTIAYTYDDLGRVILKDLPGTSLDLYLDYDLLNRVQSVRYGGYTSSNAVIYTYDKAGRELTETTSTSSYSRTMSYQYDDVNNKICLTWPGPGTLYVDYDRDLLGRVTKIRENGATSGVGVLATFTYDDYGRRASLVRGNGATTSYSYDAISRLTSLTQNLSGTANDNTDTLSYSPASQIVSQARSNNSIYGWVTFPLKSGPG